MAPTIKSATPGNPQDGIGCFIDMYFKTFIKTTIP